MLTKAKLLLAAGYPLPVDLIAALLEQGIDVAALQRKFEK
jgi:hypothetical protein